MDAQSHYERCSSFPSDDPGFPPAVECEYICGGVCRVKGEREREEGRGCRFTLSLFPSSLVPGTSTVFPPFSCHCLFENLVKNNQKPKLGGGSMTPGL